MRQRTGDEENRTYPRTIQRQGGGSSKKEEPPLQRERKVRLEGGGWYGRSDLEYFTCRVPCFAWPRQYYYHIFHIMRLSPVCMSLISRDTQPPPRATPRDVDFLRSSRRELRASRLVMHFRRTAGLIIHCWRNPRHTDMCAQY